MNNVISSFDFSDQEEVINFFVYILSNLAVERIFVRVFPTRSEPFTCGIKPIKISERQEFIGENVADRIALCTYKTGEDKFEVCISKIRKIEILQPQPQS